MRQITIVSPNKNCYFGGQKQNTETKRRDLLKALHTMNGCLSRKLPHVSEVGVQQRHLGFNGIFKTKATASVQKNFNLFAIRYIILNHTGNVCVLFKAFIALKQCREQVTAAR